MITGLSTKVHPFFFTPGTDFRLHVCPGSNKHPVEEGYPRSALSAADVQAKLDAGEAHRYCWLLDPDHFVLDVDQHSGGADGVVALSRLCINLGVNLLDACQAIVETPQGRGRHLIFKKPPEMRLRPLHSLGFAGIDTICHTIRRNALIIGAGSTHPEVDGEYRFVQTNPVAVMAPRALLDMLEDKTKPVTRVRDPGDRGRGTPGDAFMSSWDGVEELARWMSQAGYLFHLTGDDDGRPLYEFLRPDKTTNSRVSGYLGRQSQEGNFQLTSFSHSDPLFPPGESMTILEAFCRFRHGGLGFSDKDAGTETVRALATAGFGVATAEEMFADVAVGGGSGAVEGGAAAEPAGDRDDGGAGPVVAAVGGDEPDMDVFENYVIVGTGQEATKVGKTIPELIAPFVAAGAIRNCNGQLFVVGNHAGKQEIRVLPNASALFAWMGTRARIRWASGTDKVTREDFFNALLWAVKRYDSLAVTPHYPPVPGVFYLNAVKPGYLQDFLDWIDHFNPASDIDRHLMIAAAVTPFWGGPGGARPAMLVTSDDKQGSGKSTFVEAVSRLAGYGRSSMSAVGSRGDFEQLGKKLGSRSPTNPNSPRIIGVDNFAGAALGGMAIEGFLTSEQLSLYKLYVGDVEAPNLYTWFITGNYVDASEDFSQRLVEVRLAMPEHRSADWIEKLLAWDYEKVIAGIGAFFQLPIGDVSTESRFPLWAKEILGRIPKGDRLVREIKARSADVSTSGEDAEYMRELCELYAKSLIADDGVAAQTGQVFMQTSHMSEWLDFVKRRTPMGRSWSARYLGRMLKQAMPHIPELTGHRTHRTRGFLWDFDYGQK